VVARAQIPKFKLARYRIFGHWTRQKVSNIPQMYTAGGGQLLQPSYSTRTIITKRRSWATQLIDSIGCLFGAKRVDLLRPAVPCEL
jgi:hypothetical protein